METCRTCAKCDFDYEANWLDLFHPTATEIIQIRTEIHNWNLEISQNDGLPQKICTDCFSKFCTVHTFRLSCQNAQTKLNNIFEKIDTQSMTPEEIMDVELYADEVENHTLMMLNVVEFPIQITDTNDQHKSKNQCITEAQFETKPSRVDNLADLVDKCGVSNEMAMGNKQILDAVQEASSSIAVANDDNDSVTTFGFAFECKFCYKPKNKIGQHFQTQQTLLTHIQTSHHTDQPYSCPQCERLFVDAASRTVHIKSEHVEKHYSCAVCSKKYADRFNLRHHVEKYHSDTDFECEKCEKRFYSRKSLNYHMKWHNPERQFKCGHCDRLFINRRHLDCHEATHTGLRSSEYCTFCGRAFRHLKTLRWHIYRQHGGDKPYKCGNCTEVFESYTEKRLHMLERHLENLTAIERTECMHCHKQFEHELELGEHIRSDHPLFKKGALITTNNKRVIRDKRNQRYTGIFQCELCPTRFNMKSALERHVATHSTVGRPYACAFVQCKKRFKRPQDLNWHLKTHANEKPNVCDVCGKSFALKYVLTQHKLGHEVLTRDFKCSICGRAYLSAKTLRVHERIHSGKTYYKCDVCNETFVTHIKFKCHMRKKHSPIIVPREMPLDDFVNIVLD